MSTYALGDIQGCFDQLLQLLERIEFSKNDCLWIAGDLVNRGPKSLETLRFLKSLGRQARIVLGNHDLHLLAVHYGKTHQRRSDTLQPILDAPDREELMDWLRQQPLLIIDDTLGYAMAHAGVPPDWSLKNARKRSAEVEAVLKSDTAADYFEHMYGNKPDRWDSSLDGWDRLRVITNYLTRMRFCDKQGTLELKTKGSLDTQPKGYKPWFMHPRKADNLSILFGHWAALEGSADNENVFALDTGCVWGNQLTALRLEDRARFSCDCSALRKTEL